MKVYILICSKFELDYIKEVYESKTEAIQECQRLNKRDSNNDFIEWNIVTRTIKQRSKTCSKSYENKES